MILPDATGSCDVYPDYMSAIHIKHQQLVISYIFCHVFWQGTSHKTTFYFW